MSESLGSRNGRDQVRKGRMRTLLICHEGARLDQQGLAHWLASFSDLVGIVGLRETGQRMRRRIERAVKRVGLVRFLDEVSCRLYYRLFPAPEDPRWGGRKLKELS